MLKSIAYVNISKHWSENTIKEKNFFSNNNKNKILIFLQ